MWPTFGNNGFSPNPPTQPQLQPQISFSWNNPSFGNTTSASPSLGPGIGTGLHQNIQPQWQLQSPPPQQTLFSFQPQQPLPSFQPILQLRKQKSRHALSSSSGPSSVQSPPSIFGQPQLQQPFGMSFGTCTNNAPSAPLLFPTQPQPFSPNLNAFLPQQLQSTPTGLNDFPFQFQDQQPQPQLQLYPYPCPWYASLPHPPQQHLPPPSSYYPRSLFPEQNLDLSNFKPTSLKTSPTSSTLTSGLIPEDLRNPYYPTNGLDSFREWRSPHAGLRNYDILSTPSSRDLLFDRNWPLERKRASTTLTGPPPMSPRKFGSYYSPSSTNPLYNLARKEIDKPKRNYYGRNYGSYFFGGGAGRRPSSHELIKRNLRYLSARDTFLSASSNSYSRNWKVLNKKPADLYSRWHSATENKSAPRFDRELHAPKTFFDRFHCKCEAFVRAVGPPQDSDWVIGKTHRQYVLEETDTLGPVQKEMVARLPKRLEQLTQSPPKAPSPPQPQPSSSRGENMNRKLEGKTSVVFFSKPRNEVRFAPVSSVPDEPHREERRPPRRIAQIIDGSDSSVGEVRLSHEQLHCNTPKGIDPSTNSVIFSNNLEEGQEAKIYRGRAGVKLTRPKYFCVPDLRSLDDLINPQTGDCFVEEFQVGHEEFGCVTFDGFINVAGLDLDKIVEFSNMSLEINGSDREAINCSTPATIKLRNVSGTSGSIDRLRKACEKFQGKFIDYDHDRGILIFRVNEKQPPFEFPPQIIQIEDLNS